jgi:competence protein ComEA
MLRVNRAMAVGVLCGLMLAGAGRGAFAAAGADPGHRVNLNTASVEELVRLPGIGPKLAGAIVAQRTQEPFAHAEDVRKVKGIGDKLYDRIKEQVTVGEPQAAPKGRGS